MKVYHKALVVAGLCASMAAGLVGCGSEAPDGSQVAATVGEKEMTLAEVNFYLRYQQVQTEYYYESMFGNGIYEMDLYGDGSTYGESLKEGIMNQFYQYYILEDKAADYGVALTEEELAAIASAADEFIKENNAETLKQMTADKETVEKVLGLATLATKVQNKIYEAAEITVTEADALQRSFKYISVAKDGLAEEELSAKKELLSTALTRVQAGEALGDVVADMELTASTGTYGPANVSSYDEALINALSGLADGEATDLIETEDYFYVAELTSVYDESATASMYDSLVLNQRNAYYSELMTAWQKESALTINEAVWGSVGFDRSYELVTE